MAWTIRILETAEKKLRKLATQTVTRIRNFLSERVVGLNHPRQIGEPLSGPLRDYWRYRVGDHRVLCRIEDNELIVLVVDIGHRSEIYR